MFKDTECENRKRNTRVGSCIKNIDRDRTSSIPSVSTANLTTEIHDEDQTKVLDLWKCSFSKDYSEEMRTQFANNTTSDDIIRNFTHSCIKRHNSLNFTSHTTANNLIINNENSNLLEKTIGWTETTQIQLYPKKLSSHKKKQCCSCKKSNCLKLYCECFKKEVYCEGCSCPSCFNVLDYEAIRLKKIESLKAKSKVIFRKESLKEFNEKFSKGCKCKNSNCRKNYCECYQNGIGCSEFCKCSNCLNYVH